jgi:PKD repeat protein
MPGKSLQSTSCPEGSNSAQSGEAGTVEFHSGILQEHTTPNPPMPFADFTPIVNGLNVQFENNSLRSQSFLWNFGDGNTSVLEEPQHNFPGPGVYSVTLVAFNSCGNDTLSIEIQLGQLPQAAFSQTVSAGCAPVLVQFQNQSTGDFQLILWHFPGGNPEYSNLDNPSVVYSLPGVYDVRLSLFTLTDTFQIVSENAVSVTPFPEPSFTFNIQGLTVFFENTSQHSTSFNWIFGDGTTSQLESPSHTYNAPGVYAVTLNAQRPLCATSTSSNVVLLPSSTTDSDLFHHLEIFPNPASDKFFVKWKGASAEPIRYGLWHSSGMRLQSGEFYEQTEIITVNYPVGLYYLRIQHGQSYYSKKIVLWR